MRNAEIAGQTAHREWKNSAILVTQSQGESNIPEGPELMSEEQEVTELLQDWNAGDRDAAARLIPLLYQELRRLARKQLAMERRDHTLQPTALVHEAYLRLVDQESVHWKNRAQFLGVVARVMRRILVDHARAHLAAKRGGGSVNRLSLDEVEIPLRERAAEVLALDAALSELARVDERKSRVVELRFFGGLSVDETAGAMQLNPATVRRDWTVAKAWLHRSIKAAV
ncbi:MAG TPA: sigma-70 family RNA polymerase sigma factor [Chthoniobacterales bacterium]